MKTPVAALLGNGSRLHLQHGPIDLIIAVDAVENNGRQRAFEAAACRFDTVLTELVAELPLLRSVVSQKSVAPEGRIAKRMDAAVRPHAINVFITRMAAVAGAVADEILAAMICATNLTRAYVNNGGDIALYLAQNQSYSAAIAGLDRTDMGKISISANSGVRGIATSGQGGRSFSFGIADSVTVLGPTAAAADAAATLIANSVDLPQHPHILRAPANQLQSDNDLGEREVVTHVGELCEDEITLALTKGRKTADQMRSKGQIIAASLTLQGHQKLVGEPAARLTDKMNEVENV